MQCLVNLIALIVIKSFRNCVQRRQRVSAMSGKRPRRTKRQVYAARALMLNADLKKRRLEVLSDEPGPSTIPAPAPYVAGPSTVPAPAPYAETHEEERERTSSTDDEEETMRESESENERELSSSESEGDFDTDDAQHCFDDFVISLPSLARKTLSVSLMHYFQQRQGINMKQSAQEAAYITGYNEKTIREYRLDFLTNRVRFSDVKRGKYERFYLFNDENIHLEASMWVRQNAHKKGAANMTALSFCEWINNDLLPSSTLPPHFPRSVSVRTATRWLHKLGFSPMSHKKGAYVDGHEREDVVLYRREYLKKLDQLRQDHLPPPPCCDERAVTPTVDTKGKKNLVMIFHDESIFSANEGQSWIWGTGDHPYIQPKTKGAGIMVSDFITQQTGFLRLNDHEHGIAKSRQPDFPQTARGCWSMVGIRRVIGREGSLWKT